MPVTEHDALAQARTFLFVPGSRPERFEKALSSGADAVVLDLEDAVAPAEKAAARTAIAQALPLLQRQGLPWVVRLNAAGTAAGRDDLQWLAAWRCDVGAADFGGALMVPKAEDAASLAQAQQAWRGAAGSGVSARLLPLIESAAGWARLAEVAAAPGVVRLVLGHLDFQADTGLRCSEDEREIEPLRFEIAMRTRLARLAPAVDGVTTALDDEERLRRDTERALRLGFGGKLCIHPRQVAVVHAAMRPSEADLSWARRVVEADAASGGAAVQLDGRMVDLPVVLQARRMLAQAR